MCVIVLLAYGCPLLVIVKAFLLDERTVRDWQRRAGHHCQQVLEHLVENSRHDLEQVQADEIKARPNKERCGWLRPCGCQPAYGWAGRRVPNATEI